MGDGVVAVVDGEGDRAATADVDAFRRKGVYTFTRSMLAIMESSQLCILRIALSFSFSIGIDVFGGTSCSEIPDTDTGSLRAVDNPDCHLLIASCRDVA